MKYLIQDHNILGSPLDKKKHYTIIGAGVSGLMLGYFMKKNGISFEIWEASGQPGGLIRTHHLQGLGRAEQAANGFLWCAEIADICNDIGLTLLPPHAESKARFLVRHGKMSRFPLGLGETLTMMPKLLWPQARILSTVEDFGQTFFGAAFTRQLLEPAFAGIYGADIQELGFRAVLKPFAQQLNHTHSLPRAIWKWRQERKVQNTSGRMAGTLSFKEGFGVFPLRLAEQLGNRIVYHKPMTQLPDGDSILTLPAHQAAPFFQGEMAELLAGVRYTPIVTTTVFVRKEDAPLFKPGFGCLIPRSEGMELLGVLFNSSIFPDRVDEPKLLSLTCIFRDGAGQWMHKTEAEIMDGVILPDLARLLGLQKAPLGYKMFKWPQGIPLYSNDLADSWPKMEQALIREYPRIRLLGNYSGEISVRGMAQYMARAF